MKFRMRVTGGAEIQRKLEQIPQDIAAGPMQEAVMAGAEIIKAEAESNARARAVTGTLASNIFAEITKESVGTKVVAEVGPGAEGWYGKLVELGHKVKDSADIEIGEAPPHPWLRPALDNKRKEARQRMAEVLDRRLKEIWRRW